MAGETVFASVPLILYNDFSFQTLSSAVVLSFIAFLVIPFSLIINKYFKFTQERRMILTLCLTAFISSLLLISFPYFELSFERYFIFNALLYVVVNVVESFTSALLAKIYPSNLSKIGMCNAGFTIIFSTSGGKLLGDLIVTIFCILGSIDNLCNNIFVFYCFMFFIICLLIYVRYNDLRIKAIARILQRKEINN